jgi:hypothetical protein
MANLTITVDDEVLHRARRKALDQRTTINGVLRRFLELYVGGNEQDEAIGRLLSRARKSTASSGEGGRTWTRDDLYDRAAVDRR